MPIRYRCHSCGQLLSIASRMSGRTFPCPSCQATTIVPAAEVPTEAGRPLLPPMPKEWDAFSPQPGDTTVRPDVSSDAGPHAQSTAENSPDARDADAHDRPENTLELAPSSYAADENDETVEDPPDIDEDASVIKHRAEAAEAVAVRPPMADVREPSRISMFGLPSLLFGCCLVIAIFSLWRSGDDPPSRSDKSDSSPAVSPAEKLERQTILVRVDDKDNVFVDDKQVPDDSQFAARLLKSMGASARIEMVLDVDSATSKAKVDWLVKTAHGVGIHQIRTAPRDAVR